jgi:preprotein translocase subunit SecF
MRILRETNIDFMKYRKFWIILSLLLVAAGVVSTFFTERLNLGVDFAGGTQMTVRFRDEPQVDRIRSVVAQAGFPEAQIQRFNRAELNQVLIKTRLVQGSEQRTREQVVGAFDKVFNTDAAGKPDLNRIGKDEVAALLTRANPDRVGGEPETVAAHYAAQAESLLNLHKERGLFRSWDELARVPGVSQASLDALRRETSLGAFTVLSVESVGPQIGKELRSQGFWAVILSLLGMLGYIWFRFELRFGIGAIMASLHDVLVTLFFFTLAGHEFNLITVAAFLTLVGYSVNDTVVIFDRIRENMRKHRREPLLEVMNRSINETLSRTILTGGTTLLAVLSLLIFGGEVIRGFAFVMFVGILVGTYSSVYVASPFALLWEQLFGPQGRIRGGQAAAPARQTPAARKAPPRPAPEVPQQPKSETPTTPRRPESRRRAGGGRR